MLTEGSCSTEDLHDTMAKIRKERLKIRDTKNKTEKKIEKESEKKINSDNVNEVSENTSDINIDTNDIEKELAELKKNEPTSDNQFFRMSIIGYELGDLHRAIVYSQRFKNDEKLKMSHLANGKLAMADLLIQLNLLCMTLEWDFEELRKLGLEHLKERHKDFEKNRWCEIK